MANHNEDRALEGADIDRRAPLLSVTVLNYNYAHYLPQCLDSILSQTFTDFELILINDCSTDNSLEVIQPYLADPRVRLVNHEKNKGYVPSLIEGTDLSRGKYITVISADDYCLSPLAFSSLVTQMEADDNVVLAYSAFGTYGDDGARYDLVRPHEQSLLRTGIEEFADLVEAKYFILHSGTIIRTTAYTAVGGYDSSLHYAVDTNLFLMLCTRGNVTYCADELYAYRMHATNMSRNFTGFSAGLEEAVAGVKQATQAMAQAYDIRDNRYRYALQRLLISTATGTIFGGSYRCGWYAYWRAMKVRPVSTLFQPRTLSLVARTVLGPRGFQAVRSLLRSVLRRDARRAAYA